ncbi:MAG TPA: transporter substrate-binding domain-containing protein [Gammaproteobacteria bacterium]|nr:transporter substrate-binding domain-containing protein [Gammaproteobacteria bacterium]
MKPIVSGIALLSTALLLAPAVFAASLEEILARGQLQIGVSIFPPWVSRNAAGELEGFEIDVGRRVAEAMRVEPEFRVYVWDEIIDGLERGEIDMIATGMAITPLRAVRVDFSDPYSESGYTVVVNDSAVTEALGSIRDLDTESHIIATVDQTLSGQAAPLFFDSADLEVFVDPQDAEAAVLSGRVHAYMTSLPEATLLVGRFSDRLRIPLADPVGTAPAGFAVQRNNATLLEFLNEWISGVEQQQWLERAYDDWFSP